MLRRALAAIGDPGKVEGRLVGAVLAVVDDLAARP